MAKHEVKPYANKLDSKAKWPFLGNYVPKNTLTLDGILSDLAKEAGGTETQAKAILEGAFDILEQLETEGLVRYNLPGGFAVGPVIRGAFPASNSPWNPEVNRLELALAIDGTIRNELADQTAVIVTDETVTKACVHRVVDIADPAPDNLIHGTHRFRVQGKKMILLADNPPYLKNSYGTRFELVVDDPGDGQNFEAHSAELLEGGDYRLCVPTKAGEDDGIEQCPAKPVKYLKVVDPPTVEKVVSEGKDGIVKGEAFAAHGSHLSFNRAAGDSVTVKWTDEGGVEQSLVLEPTATDPAKISFDAVDAFDDLPDDTELTFEFELSGASVESRTQLLARPPRVEITNIDANVYNETELRIDIKGTNFDAVTGYLPETGAMLGQVIVNGVDKGDQDFSRDGDVWRCTGLTSHYGEEVKVILTPDPERTDIDPTPAEATVSVLEP